MAQVKDTLRVETREDVRTFRFPPEAFKGAAHDGQQGFTLSGYQTDTAVPMDLKLFVPRNADGIEAYVLKNSKKYPGHLMMSCPASAKFKAFTVEPDKSAPNGEKFVENRQVGISAVWDVWKKYRKEPEQEVVKEPAQGAEVSAEKPAGPEAGQETADRPRPIRVYDKDTVLLKFGNGCFIKGFSHGDEKDLAIFVPENGEDISFRREKRFIVITADKKAEFHLYRPPKDGSNDYENTGFFVRGDVVRKTVWRLREEGLKKSALRKAAIRQEPAKDMTDEGR